MGRLLAPSVVTAFLVCLVAALAPASAAAAPTEPARILSAAWGTSGSSSCPSGATSLDNIPVVFNWFLHASTVDASDFVFTRDDGTTVHPTCALLFPPDEPNERQTVNLIGEFGDPASVRPVRVAIVGSLQGQPIGAGTWRDVPSGLTSRVVQLEAAPFIVDAWMLTAAQLEGDPNRCTVGTAFVRVVWSNGMTAYPSADVPGQPVVDAYRAVFRLPSGKRLTLAPLAVGDIDDHGKPFLEDNMHDLCLEGVPKGAVLGEITIGAAVLQDPNGDPNRAQRFRVRRCRHDNGRVVGEREDRPRGNGRRPGIEVPVGRRSGLRQDDAVASSGVVAVAAQRGDGSQGSPGRA